MYGNLEDYHIFHSIDQSWYATVCRQHQFHHFQTYFKDSDLYPWCRHCRVFSWYLQPTWRPKLLQGMIKSRLIPVSTIHCDQRNYDGNSKNSQALHVSKHPSTGTDTCFVDYFNKLEWWWCIKTLCAEYNPGNVTSLHVTDFMTRYLLYLTEQFMWNFLSYQEPAIK